MNDAYDGVGEFFNKVSLNRQTISKGLKEKFFKITINCYLPLFSQLINLVVSNTYRISRLFFKFLTIRTYMENRSICKIYGKSILKDYYN